MTTTRTRKLPARFARLFDHGTSLVIGITAGKDTTFYGLEAMPSDFGRAFRLTKAERGNGPEESYDVCLMDGGRSTCECKGHLAHGHKTVCKHIAALFQLEKLGLLPAQVTKAHARSQAQPIPTDLDDL